SPISVRRIRAFSRLRSTCAIASWRKLSRQGDRTCRAMDFTSALSLGLSHPSETLRWKELTQGTPAALRPPEGAPAAERAFAALVGCERAQVFTSTLHAFSD